MVAALKSGFFAVCAVGANWKSKRPSEARNSFTAVGERVWVQVAPKFSEGPPCCVSSPGRDAGKLKKSGESELRSWMYRAEIVSASRGTKSILYVHCVSGFSCGGAALWVRPVSTTQSPFAAREAAGQPLRGPISTVLKLF
jgi:hypothetical protein